MSVLLSLLGQILPEVLAYRRALCLCMKRMIPKHKSGGTTGLWEGFEVLPSRRGATCSCLNSQKSSLFCLSLHEKTKICQRSGQGASHSSTTSGHLTNGCDKMTNTWVAPPTVSFHLRTSMSTQFSANISGQRSHELRLKTSSAQCSSEGDILSFWSNKNSGNNLKRTPVHDLRQK